MIIHKVWKAEKKWHSGSIKETRVKEGWFLFGFIPLFTRTIQYAL